MISAENAREITQNSINTTVESMRATLDELIKEAARNGKSSIALKIHNTSLQVIQEMIIDLERHGYSAQLDQNDCFWVSWGENNDKEAI